MNFKDISSILDKSISEKKAKGIFGSEFLTSRLDIVLGEEESPYDFLRAVSEHPEEVKKLLKEKGYDKPVIKFKYRLGKEIKSSLYIAEN